MNSIPFQKYKSTYPTAIFSHRREVFPSLPLHVAQVVWGFLNATKANTAQRSSPDVQYKTLMCGPFIIPVLLSTVSRLWKSNPTKTVSYTLYCRNNSWNFNVYYSYIGSYCVTLYSTFLAKRKIFEIAVTFSPLNQWYAIFLVRVPVNYLQLWIPEVVGT
jgi:hypothetical protein